MNYYKLFYSCCLCLILPFSCFAQEIDPVTIKKNLNVAIENFQKKDSLFLDAAFQQELKTDYFERIISLKPEDFGNKSKAKSLINYYSGTAGMEKIIRDFIGATEKDWDGIFSIGMVLYQKIYFNSDNPDAMMAPNLNNKYATLIIQIEPEKQDASIYLNGKLICLVTQAKNGIRVHSNEKYKVEIKSGAKIVCSKELTLEKQEKKIDKCVVNN